MSQRRWLTRNGWVVLTGWDANDHGHFLTVFTDEMEDEVIYTSLSDAKATDLTGSITLERLFEVLDSLQIEPPSSLRGDLLGDQERNAGNVAKTYPQLQGR